VAELDVRPGGANLIVMRGPDGKDMPNRGVYLEVVPNERLVFTDAYVKAWEPSDKPFMTVILTFEDEGGKTRYTARVRHWTVADREAHEKMGFHQGPVHSQLAELAATCEGLCLVYLDREHWSACSDAECADYQQLVAGAPARGRAAAHLRPRCAVNDQVTLRRPVRRDARMLAGFYLVDAPT
jgi:hypothetical protein